MFETIKYETNNNIAWITLNRPDKLNAFTEQLNKEIEYAVKQASKDKLVRCLVITGEGRAFSSGQDLEDVLDNPDYGEVLRKRYHPMVLAIDKCKKPIIAAVNGVAAGAGMSLALACDFRLLSEKASFIQAFIHVGLVPDAGNLYYLPKLIGHAKALELAILGEKVTAIEAKELGLATKVIPVDKWTEEIAIFAEKLAARPTKSIELIKRSLKESWYSPIPEYLEREAQSQRIAGLTNDHREGITAFLEKRNPIFQGK